MGNRVCKRSLTAYLALWALFAAAFWFRWDSCGMAYTLLAYYIVLPVAAAAVCAAWGWCGGKKMRFAIPFALTAGQALLWALTIGVNGALLHGRWYALEFWLLPFTLVPALAGLTIGCMARALWRKGRGCGKGL